MSLASDTHVTERWDLGLTTQYDVVDRLDSEATPFQALEIVETKMFGKMLLLDGVVQTTEHDEFLYHEMMVHVPMLAHGAAKRVLIIGGGDGGILREVLKHDCVEQAVMVEIDPAVPEFCARALPSLSTGAFDDPRAELIYADGAEWVAETDREFDVMIVDSTDPIGPGAILFEREFYQNSAHILDPAHGVFVRQSGSIWTQPDELPQCIALADEVFAHAAGYLYSVPTYVGGLFSSLFASHGISPEPDLPALQTRFKRAALAGDTRAYTPEIHFGAFALPPFLQDRIDEFRRQFTKEK